MTFSNGRRSIDLYWSSAAEHRGNLRSIRRDSQAAWSLPIAGERATLFQRSDPAEFTAVWTADNRALLVGGRFDGVDEYRSILASVRRVDVNAWLSALPKSVVQPYAR